MRAATNVLSLAGAILAAALLAAAGAVLGLLAAGPAAIGTWLAERP
jgi:hypothetical protein